MSRICAKDFVGTRARFQRLRDAKLFHGWIEEFFGNQIVLTTSTDSAVAIGDEFRVEGFGNLISVVFQAKLESIGAFDVLAAGGYQAIEGSNARILEAHKASFHLVVTSPVRYSASQETVRYQIAEAYTVLTVAGEQIAAFTVDVAPNGIGVFCQASIELGTTIRVSLETSLGPIKAEAVVRYCRPAKERPGYNRVGIMFVDMGRIERPRWERYVREQS